eukprot:17348-Heterococcus_DN1.PRE.9
MQRTVEIESQLARSSRQYTVEVGTSVSAVVCDILILAMCCGCGVEMQHISARCINCKHKASY